MFKRISHHKTSKMYILEFFRKTTIVSCRRCQIMLAWAETRWGRKKSAAEEKSSNDLVTFDTEFQMRNGYSTRNLTKCASFDVNWYRQWPVAGSVGCLSVSTKAYQMTLKISSTTIMLEGRRRTFHVWRACECTRWKERFEQPSLITPIVLFMEISKDGSDSVGWCPDLWRCSKKPDSHTQLYMYMYIF